MTPLFIVGFQPPFIPADYRHHRPSNGNASPRVLEGPKLARRFQTLTKETILAVDVYSPTSIRVRPAP